MDSLFSAIVSVFKAPVSWFGSILESTSTVDIFLAGILIMLVYRFILAPIFGAVVFSAVSDKVERIRGKDPKAGQKQGQNRSRGRKK